MIKPIQIILMFLTLISFGCKKDETAKSASSLDYTGLYSGNVNAITTRNGSSSSQNFVMDLRISKDNSGHFLTANNYYFNANKEIIKVVDSRVNGFGGVWEYNIKVSGGQLNYQCKNSMYNANPIFNETTMYNGILNK